MPAFSRPRASAPRLGRRRARALAVALLALGLAGFAQFPPAPVADFRGLLPPLDPALLSSGEPLGPDATAAEHRARLSRHPASGRAFVVDALRGDADARTTVFVIPQFHRSPGAPLGWTSVGAAVRKVQRNIDLLVTVLTSEHGLSAIGTEGTWAAAVPRSEELRRVAFWRHDLETAQAQALRALRDDGPAAAPAMETVRAVLDAALADHFQLLDGVGMAQARRPPDAPPLLRFGLESRALNREALALAERLSAVERALAERAPETHTEVADTLAQIWLDEEPLYEQSTLGPLRESFAALDALRRHLRQDGAEYPAAELGRFVALAKRVTDAVIQPEAVAALTAHYRAVAARSPAVDGGPPPAPPAPGPAERAQRAHLEETQRARLEEMQRARLEKKRDRLQARYEAVTMQAREAQAAALVLDAHARGHRVLAAVMGAHHEEGLVQALLDAARARGVSLGVVVVRPFLPDD